MNCLGGFNVIKKVLRRGMCDLKVERGDMRTEVEIKDRTMRECWQFWKLEKSKNSISLEPAEGTQSTNTILQLSSGNGSSSTRVGLLPWEKLRR